MRKGTSTASSSRIYLASAETTLKRAVIWKESFHSWVCASSPSTIIMTVQRKTMINSEVSKKNARLVERIRKSSRSGGYFIMWEWFCLHFLHKPQTAPRCDPKCSCGLCGIFCYMVNGLQNQIPKPYKIAFSSFTIRVRISCSISLQSKSRR